MLERWLEINVELVKKLNLQSFAPPVAHVYNPLDYAAGAYEAYLCLYGMTTRSIMFLGMNPGPWGMVQTGIPFGEVAAVKEWLGISSGVQIPPLMRPKRPVQGFS
mgnify:CR=1 FL=1